MLKVKEVAIALASAATGFILWRVTGIEILAVVGLAASIVIALEASAKRKAKLLSDKVAAWPGFLEYLVSALESGLPLIDALIEGVEYFDGPVRDLLASLRSKILNGHSIAEALKMESQWRTFGPFLELAVQLQAFEYCGAPGLAADLRTAAERCRARASLEAELSARLGWLMATVRMATLAPWFMIAVLAQRAEAREAYQGSTGVTLLWLSALLCGAAYLLIKRQQKSSKSGRILWELA